MKMKIFLVFLLSFLSFQQLEAQYITVDDTYTAADLVNNVLFSGSCASVSNVSVSGGNFGSGQQSWGYFDGNGSSFPFQNGIILSSGKIDNAPGPNSYISDDGANIGWGGDTDLNRALNISNSLNATVLEFDFIPVGTQISFNYIFSSEEYHGTATCTYSDGFAFLLKEVGSSTYQNLAVLPGTNTPVKVTNVHPDIPGGCSAQNEQYFDAFNGVNHPTNYNGQTVSMTAQANVNPGATYHIKLVIADEGNYRYDSAIFLQGGSFNFGLDLGDDRTVANGNPLCSTDSPFTIGEAIPGATYQWYQDNVLLVGETNATLDVTTDGNYKVEISIGTCPPSSSDIDLEFAPVLHINQNDFTECDADDNQDGMTSFNLNSIANQLFTNLPSSFQVNFYEIGSSSPLPSNYTNTTPFQQIINARISNVNCYSDFPVTLNVNTFVENINDVTIGLCNTNSEILEADSGFSSYLWDDGSTTSSITVSTAGTYTVQITNSQNCTKIKTFYVVGSEIATITNIEINDFASNNTATILVTGTGNYEYSLDGIHYQDISTFEHLEEGEYTVYVQDKNGCGIAVDTFYILNYPKYFTPNGDGYNDYWNIKNMDKRGLQTSKIYIFDRFGKLIKQIAPEGLGWDGTSNGYQLPASDYWFTAKLTNGRTIKGHFALKR